MLMTICLHPCCCRPAEAYPAMMPVLPWYHGCKKDGFRGAGLKALFDSSTLSSCAGGMQDAWRPSCMQRLGVLVPAPGCLSRHLVDARVKSKVAEQFYIGAYAM
jgi:hypothetical protein